MAGHGRHISTETLQVGEYEVELTRKRIKRAWLRVTTADGPVQLSAPQDMSAERIVAFVQSQAGWIERRRAELAKTGVTAPRGSHVAPTGLVMLWGEWVSPESVLRASGRVRISGDSLVPGSPACERAVAEALRGITRSEAEPLMRRWEARMGVHASGLSIHDTVSRWGSCNVRTHKINLSLWLAHYPHDCLELIVVHELTHLLEASHNSRFHALMDAELPDWRERERLLRQLSQGR